MRLSIPRVLSALSLAGVVAGASLTLSCDELSKQLSATDFAVAVLLNTPPVPNPKDPNNMLPGIATLSVLVGAADPTAIASGTVSAGAISPESDATVTIDFSKSGTPVSVTVPSKSNGLYAVTSKDSMLELTAGTEYVVTIVRAGKTYKLKGTAATTPVKIKEFNDPNPRIITSYDFVANNGFKISRDGDPATNKVAFVAMQAIDSNTTASATPTSSGLTYTNVPTGPVDFLKLVLDPSEWQANSFTIPASKFMPMTPYIVTMTEVTQGSQVTDSSVSALQPQSTFFIGTADGGGVITK